ncbi:YveK family protein [Bacillus sp. T3]|uniref:YveK family protein n=1 Tax=Bacillus sp. T3 TaxID=467262 RepID=UPI00298119FE|nr:Wzz/FepE/Etk N-terminal domain-containing protein [Bacillus sp. T3]
MEGIKLIKDLIKVFKKYIWIILLGVLVGGGIGKLLVPSGPAPTYKSSALILVQKKQAETGVVISQGDETGRFLNTAVRLIETRAILDDVKNELDLKESTKDLEDMIEVVIESNSNIIKVTVESEDANKATDIANATIGAFAKQASQYLDIDSATVVEKAKNGLETQILHTRSNANIAMGVILGLIISTIAAFWLNSVSNRKKHVK